MQMNGTGYERTALVLYGTETGTSQDVAEEVGRLAQRLHFNTEVAGFDDVTITELLSHTVTIFVIATTGQGEFPKNVLAFWKSLLRKKLPRDFFRGVHYALAGLGDSSYPKYNWAARKLEKRLQQLRAEPILDSCEADEQDEEGTEGAILPWLQSLSATLLSTYPLANGLAPIPQDRPLPSRWLLTPAVEGTKSRGKCEIFPSASPDLDRRPIPGALTAVLTGTARVTPSDHWQDVRLLVLETEQKIAYFPGDALAITPKNFAADVDLLASLMGWESVCDSPMSLQLNELFGHQATNSTRSPIPHLSSHPNVTLRTLLAEYLDITAIPRRSFFAATACYASDEMQKERLLEFADPQFLDEYFDYATRPRRSILEILQEFSSVQIPWEEACNIFPLIRPRQFSIASGGPTLTSNRTKGRFELLVAIVKYRTVIKKIRQGVCTRYLAALPQGSTLKVVLRTEGRFPLNYEHGTRRNLLIGAGTGIAPLRALIHEDVGKLTAHHNVSNQRHTLIFGARSQRADFFFNDEWTNLAAGGAGGFNLITAFSRDQKEKIYVQDRIREHGKAIVDLILDGNASIFVCGSSGAMPKAVREALLDVLVEYASIEQHWTREEAEDFLADMDKQKRFVQETW